MEGLVKISVHLLCRGRIQESAVDWRWRAAVAWKTVDYVRIVDDRGQARPRKKSKEYNKRHPKKCNFYKNLRINLGHLRVVRLASRYKKKKHNYDNGWINKKQGDDDDDDDDDDS